MIGSHIIPRYYLEQFATKKKPTAKTGQLWIFSMKLPPRLGTAKSEGIENGYFAVRTASGRLDETLENHLAILENNSNEVLVNAPEENFEWSRGSRQKLAMYVGLLYARARARRDATAWIAERASKELLRLLQDPEFLEEMAEHYSQLAKRPVDLNVLRNVLEQTSKEQVAPESKSNFFLEELLPTATMVSQVLLGRNWQIWKAPRDMEFITTDNPVITMLPVNGIFAPGFGFHHAGVLVAIPLNPKSCLVVGGTGGDILLVEPETVERINEVQILCMYMNAYSRTKSDWIESVVNERGGQVKFGENAFIVPGDWLPLLKQVFRARFQRQTGVRLTGSKDSP